MPDTARLHSLAPSLWGAAVDIPALSLLAAVTVVALVMAWRAPDDTTDV